MMPSYKVLILLWQWSDIEIDYQSGRSCQGRTRTCCVLAVIVCVGLCSRDVWSLMWRTWRCMCAPVTLFTIYSSFKFTRVIPPCSAVYSRLTYVCSRRSVTHLQLKSLFMPNDTVQSVYAAISWKIVFSHATISIYSYPDAHTVKLNGKMRKGRAF